MFPSPSETSLSPSSSSSTFILSPTSVVRGINDNPSLHENPPAEIPDDVKPSLVVVDLRHICPSLSILFIKFVILSFNYC
ncbi:hypothetical protein SOVF_157240 [Spinacia oleracea]|nr:hypothetical protein SOVF_157240 [Spinacia oleracea]